MPEVGEVAQSEDEDWLNMESSAPAEDSAALNVGEAPSVLDSITEVGPALTLEEAQARLGPDVLKVLEEKFNGSLTEVRARDEKDQFFQ